MCCCLLNNKCAKVVVKRKCEERKKCSGSEMKIAKVSNERTSNSIETRLRPRAFSRDKESKTNDVRNDLLLNEFLF